MDDIAVKFNLQPSNYIIIGKIWGIAPNAVVVEEMFSIHPEFGVQTVMKGELHNVLTNELLIL